MARLVIENPTPDKGRVIHGADGGHLHLGRRCRICGRTVRTRGARLCPDCFADSMGNGCGAGACAGGACAPHDLDKLLSDGEGMRT